MCLTYIMYSLLARSLELISSYVKNRLIYQNLYIINRQLCIATYYSKRNWLNKETLVLRYIYSSLADLLVKYLTFVKLFVNLLKVIIHSLSKLAATIVKDISKLALPLLLLLDFEKPIDNQSDCRRVKDTLYNTNANLINKNNNN
jgi:hypothetical protein